MTVRVGEMTTQVESVPDVAAAAAGAAGTHGETPAARERARQLAERAAQIARRTRAEGYDD